MRFFASIVFALALLVGQQAAARHDLAHAGDLHHSCDQCFVGAQLAGAAPPTIPSVPALAADDVPQPVHTIRGAQGPARLAFRSQAPPAVL